MAGNLPYNVASPIMFRLVELSRRGHSARDATVMLQREVADRLLAMPGTGDYGVLTLLVGHRASVDRLLNLPPGAFRPPPKVHSTVVRLRFHPPEPPVRDERLFAGSGRAPIFSRRRKTHGERAARLRSPLTPRCLCGGRRRIRCRAGNVDSMPMAGRETPSIGIEIVRHWAYERPADLTRITTPVWISASCAIVSAAIWLC